jgi:hypothetical protein
MGRQPLPRPHTPEPVHGERTDQDPAAPRTNEPTHEPAHTAFDIGLAVVRTVEAISLLLIAGLFALLGLSTATVGRCELPPVVDIDFRCSIDPDQRFVPLILFALAVILCHAGLGLVCSARISNYVLGSLLLLTTLALGTFPFFLGNLVIVVAIFLVTRRNAELRRAANSADPPRSQGRHG